MFVVGEEDLLEAWLVAHQVGDGASAQRFEEWVKSPAYRAGHRVVADDDVLDTGRGSDRGFGHLGVGREFQLQPVQADAVDLVEIGHLDQADGQAQLTLDATQRSLQHQLDAQGPASRQDRKSTRLNSSHSSPSRMPSSA